MLQVYFIHQSKQCKMNASAKFSNISISGKSENCGLKRYPNNFPPRKIVSRLGFGFVSRLGLVLWLRGNQTIGPEENCPPVGVRVWDRVSFGVGGNFPLGQLS